MRTAVELMQQNMHDAANSIADMFLDAPVGELPASISVDFAKHDVPGSDYALVEQMHARIGAHIREHNPSLNPTLGTSIERSSFNVTVTVTLSHA